MDDKERMREQSLYRCEQLMLDLKRNKEEAQAFLGGEIYRAYVKATEEAIQKTRKVRTKIRNL